MTDTEFHDDQPALDLRNTHRDPNQSDFTGMTTDIGLYTAVGVQAARQCLYGLGVDRA